MAFLCKQLRTSYSRRNATRSVINCFLVSRSKRAYAQGKRRYNIFVCHSEHDKGNQTPHDKHSPALFLPSRSLSANANFCGLQHRFFRAFLLAKFVVHKLQSDHAQLLRISFGTAALLIEIKYMIIFNHILPHQNVRVRAFQTEFNATNFFGFSSFSLNRVCGCGCKCFSTQFVCKSSDHSVPFSSVMV